MCTRSHFTLPSVLETPSCLKIVHDHRALMLSSRGRMSMKEVGEQISSVIFFAVSNGVHPGPPPPSSKIPCMCTQVLKIVHFRDRRVKEVGEQALAMQGRSTRSPEE